MGITQVFPGAVCIGFWQFWHFNLIRHGKSSCISFQNARNLCDVTDVSFMTLLSQPAMYSNLDRNRYKDCPRQRRVELNVFTLFFRDLWKLSSVVWFLVVLKIVGFFGGFLVVWKTRPTECFQAVFKPVLLNIIRGDVFRLLWIIWPLFSLLDIF